MNAETTSSFMGITYDLACLYAYLHKIDSTIMYVFRTLALFVVFGPSLPIQGVLHGVGTGRDHLTFHQVAYHFKVMFGCFGHLRDKCLKLGPLARNLQAIHQPLRIWGSLTCRIKTQHQSHPTDPPRAPQLATFSCLCHICL